MSANETTSGEIEKLAIVAHRSYLSALEHLEELFRQLGDEAFNRTGGTGSHAAAMLASADRHKEVCRSVFRDLIDELGFIPTFNNAAS